MPETIDDRTARQPTQIGISFDLFGTLLKVERPVDPTTAVASSLSRYDIPVPQNWTSAYGQPHLDVDPGRECSLVDHVRAILTADGTVPPEANIEAALMDAFDTEVRVLPGANRAISDAGAYGPVGILSNCTVPGLAEHYLHRSSLPDECLDAIVTSVGCGWRKPHPKAFQTIADQLGVAVPNLVHIGDNPDTDGGASSAGAHAVLVDDDPLSEIEAVLEEAGCPR